MVANPIIQFFCFRFFFVQFFLFFLLLFWFYFIQKVLCTQHSLLEVLKLFFLKVGNIFVFVASSRRSTIKCLSWFDIVVVLFDIMMVIYFPILYSLYLFFASSLFLCPSVSYNFVVIVSMIKITGAKKWYKEYKIGK